MLKAKNRVLSFSVLYEEAPEGGYVVSVPTLPGCHTQGDTIDEAEKNVKEAIGLYLESLQSRGDEIPQDRRILQGTIGVQAPFPL